MLNQQVPNEFAYAIFAANENDRVVESSKRNVKSVLSSFVIVRLFVSGLCYLHCVIAKAGATKVCLPKLIYVTL